MSNKQIAKTNSREAIIGRIRQNKPEEKPLPKYIEAATKLATKTELIIQIKQSLEKAGAHVIEFAQTEDLQSCLDKQLKGAIDLTNAETRKKYASDISKEKLGKIKIILISGQFGVAENGAIWLDESNFTNRLLPFISEQMVIVLSKENIVGNMQEAYQRIKLDDTGFGVFISGPSKTADIEQCLVLGAHGVKKLVCIITF